jgi:hypothetical protein
MVHVVGLDNYFEHVPGDRMYFDHVVNRSISLLQPVVAHIVVSVSPLIILARCVTLTCLTVVQRHIWTWTRGIMMAQSKPATSVQKKTVPAIQQHSSKISPTKYVVRSIHRFIS